MRKLGQGVRSQGTLPYILRLLGRCLDSSDGLQFEDEGLQLLHRPTSTPGIRTRASSKQNLVIFTRRNEDFDFKNLSSFIYLIYFMPYISLILKFDHGISIPRNSSHKQLKESIITVLRISATRIRKEQNIGQKHQKIIPTFF